MSTWDPVVLAYALGTLTGLGLALLLLWLEPHLPGPWRMRGTEHHPATPALTPVTRQEVDALAGDLASVIADVNELVTVVREVGHLPPEPDTHLCLGMGCIHHSHLVTPRSTPDPWDTPAAPGRAPDSPESPPEPLLHYTGCNDAWDHTGICSVAGAPLPAPEPVEVTGGPCHACRRNVGQAHTPGCPALVAPEHLGAPAGPERAPDRLEPSSAVPMPLTAPGGGGGDDDSLQPYHYPDGPLQPSHPGTRSQCPRCTP